MKPRVGQTNGSRHYAPDVTAIVRACGAPEHQVPSYVAFGQELLCAMRRPPVPDFTRRAKRIIVKWHNRGLSGLLLRRIGFEIIERRFGQVREVKDGCQY